jgi:DNA polymerase III delta subunit
MIYFVTGEQREKVLKKSQELVVALQKKRPEALLFRISADEWDKNAFAGIAGGQGLFEHKYIVVLDSIFQNEDAAQALADQMKELKAADHAFLFVETSPKDPTKALLKKHAEKVWEVDGEKIVAKKSFNIFSLTDALGARNKARLWALYQEALMDGSEPEEIHGILFWQVKSLLAAAQSKNADEAGMKPFVWGKSQGFLKNYSLDELKGISSKMVGLYHLSRLESVPLEVAMEEWMLEGM